MPHQGTSCRGKRCKMSIADTDRKQYRCPTSRVKEARCNIVMCRHYPIEYAMLMHTTGYYRRGRWESFDTCRDFFQRVQSGFFGKQF